MDAHLTTIISYVAASAGLAIALFAMFTGVNQAQLNWRMANMQLQKLLRARNVQRAGKLCEAAGPRTYMRAVGAAIAAGLDANTRDPVKIAAITGPAFERKGKDLVAQYRARVGIGQLGAILSAGGAALSASGSLLPPPLLGISGVALLAGVWMTTRKSELDRALQAARRDVLPDLDQAFVDGG